MPTARLEGSGKDVREGKTENAEVVTVSSRKVLVCHRSRVLVEDRIRQACRLPPLESRVNLIRENVPSLYRLRMDCSSQDQDSIFLQEYRRIVTSIRQEDIGVDVHDKRCPTPSMCGSSHMPRKEEGSAHKRTKPQTPTPKGDISSTDERVKADRETQRRERGQAKQRALQHANVPAKSSMRERGTESESNVVRKETCTIRG